jgi:lipopolysaccharide transport system ATP-binding protein
MHPVVIQLNQIGKRYRIGPRQERYRTLRDTLAEVAVSPFRKIRKSKRSAQEFIWALRNVSLEVNRGEVLGIIGPNGAGKSTLLKLLSRITKPTEGTAEIHGRVASMLEVGVGFHPELTGRENIYLNGAILGMKKSQIDSKFDKIVSFAEVERFIDTPTKHYSSGMYMRLAFAVAAHLEPDILLVDEVLAVGDVAFQKKCLGKLDDVTKQGRTVLFVSHNMVAIQSLCNRVVWLNEGGIVEDGRPGHVISNYLKTNSSTRTEQAWSDIAKAPGNDTVRIRRIRLRPEGGTPLDSITVDTALVMEFEYWNLKSDAHLHLSLHVYNEHGVLAFNTGPANERVWHGRPFPAGLFRSVCRVPAQLLNNGTHRVRLLVIQNQGFVCFQLNDALIFDVRDTERQGWLGEWPGAVRPNLEWTTEFLESIPPIHVTRM